VHVHCSTERVNPSNGKFQPAVAGKFRGRLFVGPIYQEKNRIFSKGLREAKCMT
jgi:hypothetical protein